ncbi:hypothetical protein PHK61_31280 [Actinomycetospora lutea]|nr:hypothetical protein [Actinomycetospora lutea]MDD7942902.1 hypothetical protein [Actinomycetospora lutea]
MSKKKGCSNAMLTRGRLFRVVVANAAHQSLLLAQHPLCAAVHLLSGWCQSYGVLLVAHQRRLEVAFEALHVEGDRALAEPEVIRGSREPVVLHHGDEDAQLREVQAHRLILLAQSAVDRRHVGRPPRDQTTTVAS